MKGALPYYAQRTMTPTAVSPTAFSDASGLPEKTQLMENCIIHSPSMLQGKSKLEMQKYVNWGNGGLDGPPNASAHLRRQYAQTFQSQRISFIVLLLGRSGNTMDTF